MKIILSLFGFIFSVCSAQAAELVNTASLYSYSGYLGTPSAYITDGRLGLHYTYLPNHVGPYFKNRSENSVYSGTLGFLPFMEVYFSAYVAPQIKAKGIVNYGSGKTRSGGMKIRIIQERTWIPTIAVGMFDPEINKSKEFRSQISSVFFVTSKKLSFGTVSLGYGANWLAGPHARLQGLFGGIGIPVNKYISLLADYDAKYFSMGLNARWHGIDILAGNVIGNGLAYRIGYNWQLTD